MKRVADVHADPDLRALEVVFDERHQRFGARQRIGNDFDGEADACPVRHGVQFLDAASCRLAADCPCRALRRSRARPDGRRGSDTAAPREGERRFGLRQRLLSPRLVGDRVRERLAPGAVGEAGADRGVDAVQRQPRVVEPLAERANGRLVVIVEVRSRGKQLDAVQAVRRDLDEVLAVEALVVKEVRGHAKTQGAHTVHLSSPHCRRSLARDARAEARSSDSSNSDGFVALAYRSSSTRSARISCRRPKRGYFARLAAHVIQRARDVLDVDRIAAHDGLIAERAERLQVPLQRHQIEPASELGGVLARDAARAVPQGEEVRDELVHLARREIDVRVAQQRRQVVGVRPHARVLKVDDDERSVVQHQVAAVIIAMAQHARARPASSSTIAGHSAASAALHRRAHRRAAIRAEEVLDEELQLPGQLLDVERHPVWRIRVGRRARRRARCIRAMSDTAWR